LSRRWQSQRRAKPARSLTLTLGLIGEVKRIEGVTVNRKTIAIVSIASLFFVSACSDDSSSPNLSAEGTWGAEHLRLVVESDGAVLEYDCAHGTIDGAFVFDSDGNFDLVGTHVHEGGPIGEDNPPEVLSVRYLGRIVGDIMMIQVRLSDSGEILGRYALHRGQSGEIRKCL
jgi:hypothetical protein